MNKFVCFPTDVYVRDDCEIDNKKLSKIILEKEKTEPSKDISNEGGWQSESNLYTDEKFSEILKEVELCFDEVIYEQTNYKKGVCIKIVSLWANVNRYRDYNSPHTHGECEWSFVYYVKLPKNSGKLVLTDPRIRRSASVIRGFIENYDNPFTHDAFIAQPPQGSLILFPSWLEHYVQYNSSKQPRISISGNIVMRNRNDTKI